METRTRSRGMRISDEVHRALKVRSAHTGIPMERIVEDALRKELGLEASTRLSRASKGQQSSMEVSVVKLVNLTPHAIHLRESADSEPLLTIPPTDPPARVAVERVQAGEVAVDGVTIPVYATRMGQVENLPDPQPGVYYIVSRVVAEAARDRDDLFVVDDAVRDAEGRIVGARALARV